ncbi:hypothetical protein SAMN05518871_102496 [Psychrobacillus sp. OK028]|uniref:nucleotidyltransferase n=1 Tax=Psychrobacillus sp. OK028 TaxID=1884359 RepID=UPI00087FA56C|nr:nucleotidyltransferase [Psychrobacillus sp. OK028]SDM89181.1 hypothetical protein SAMN05518871_102496 [Psychrobacillus sp. OK028]
MRTLSSYIMFVGILWVAVIGNWIIQNYDHVSVYPKAAHIAFGSGLGGVFLAYLMKKFSTYKENHNVEKKDNRDVINKWDDKGSPYSKWLFGIVVVSLVIAAFYSWSLSIKMLNLYLFVGFVLIGFHFVMKGERVEEPDDLNFKGKTKNFLDLIDYRWQPFNISLIVFSLVVWSFLWSKHFDIPMYLEIGGNPRYVTSLPASAFVMSGLMIVSTFIFIINNGDIFGIRKARQNGLKVLQIHFVEIISCGVTFFILVVTLIEAFVLRF